MNSKLYRSRNVIISGVCSGFAEYFHIDPTIIRVVWALIAIPEPFLAIIGYLVCAIIIPQKPIEGYGYDNSSENFSQSNEDYEHNDYCNNIIDNKISGNTVGIALILVGVSLILKQFFDWFSFFKLWPALLIIIGIYIILKKR